LKLQKADIVFSEFIRKRDADENGICHCPLCLKVGHWTTFVCGHYIKRRHLSTRWYPDNAFAICQNCNGQMESDTELLNRYASWIMAKIGLERWSALMIQSQVDYKYMQFEIDAITEKYRK